MIDKTFLTFRIIFTAFSLFVVLTFFMPMISLDKYVEYEFNYGYYNADYSAYSEPVAKKVSPLDIVSSLTVDRQTIFETQQRVKKVEAELTAQYDNGQITLEEMQEALASNRDVGKSIIHKIVLSDGAYAVLTPQLQTFSLLLIMFYVLFFAFFLINLLNLILDRKMLYMASYQTSWFITLLWIITIVFIFAFSFTTSKEVLATGQLVEYTTLCGAPSSLTYITTLSMVAYIFISKVVNENYFVLSYLESEKTHDGRKKSNYFQIEKYLSKNKTKTQSWSNNESKEK